MKVRRLVKKIDNKSGGTSDYLDFDNIMSMMLEEFKN